MLEGWKEEIIKVSMDSQLFYLLNAIFGVTLVVWFFAGRKSAHQPNPLNLKKEVSVEAKSKIEILKGVQESLKSPQAKEPNRNFNYKPRERDVTSTRKIAEEALSKVEQKSLSCLFIYNGHDWNAYDVLGIKTPVTLPELTERYQNLVKTSDPAQIDFYEVAYKALLQEITQKRA